MSKSIFWTPPPKEQKEHHFGLKREIGRYFDNEWNGDSGSWTADTEIVPFLEGIIAVGNEQQKADAMELIDAIEKYGSIVITIA